MGPTNMLQKASQKMGVSLYAVHPTLWNWHHVKNGIEGVHAQLSWILMNFLFFPGKVDILLNSQEPRDYFLVHSKYLEIDESHLFLWKSSSHRVELELKPVLRSDKNEFLILATPETAQAGNYTISLSKSVNLQTTQLHLVSPCFLTIDRSGSICTTDHVLG